MNAPIGPSGLPDIAPFLGDGVMRFPDGTVWEPERTPPQASGRFGRFTQEDWSNHVHAAAMQVRYLAQVGMVQRDEVADLRRQLDAVTAERDRLRTRVGDGLIELADGLGVEAGSENDAYWHYEGVHPAIAEYHHGVRDGMDIARQNVERHVAAAADTEIPQFRSDLDRSHQETYDLLYFGRDGIERSGDGVSWTESRPSANAQLFAGSTPEADATPDATVGDLLDAATPSRQVVPGAGVASPAFSPIEPIHHPTATHEVSSQGYGY